MLTEPFNNLVLYPETLDSDLNEKKAIDQNKIDEIMNTTKYLYLVYRFGDSSDDLVYAECTGLTWHSPKIFGYDQGLKAENKTLAQLETLNLNNDILVVKVWVGSTDIGQAAIEYLNPADGSRENMADGTGYPVITKKMNYDLKNQSFGSDLGFSNNTYETAGNLVIAFYNKSSSESYILTVDDTDQVLNSSTDFSTPLMYKEIGSSNADSYYTLMEQKQDGQLD